MADPEHLKILRQGVAAWNEWRREFRGLPNLADADLTGENLALADFGSAVMIRAKLSGATLNHTQFPGANLGGADLAGADMRLAALAGAHLDSANLRSSNLDGAMLHGANMTNADLTEARLVRAHLNGVNLTGAKLRSARLDGADLRLATLVDADLRGAVLTGCRVYGISVWRARLDEATRQQDLVITGGDEPDLTLDNIEVAQFVYLLLHNEKIRDIIDTVGRKGVLLLGRFTEGRIAVLDRLRDELRKRGYVPIVFNFDKPETKDFTETVRLLAGLSHFVIADITNPKSAPLELQATVPEIMVPFQPIIEEGQQPFSMLTDLWIKHRDWVFEPIHFSSVDALVGILDKEIIEPAEARFDQLIVRKAETMKGKHV